MEQIALVFGLVGLVAFIKKLNDLWARVINGAYRSALSQLVVYAITFVGLVVFSKSAIAGSLEIVPGHTLESLSVVDLIIASLGFGSIASLVYDNNQAKDPTVETITHPMIPDGTIDNL